MIRKAVDLLSNRAYVGRRSGIHAPGFRLGQETRLLRVRATRDGTEPIGTEKKG